jgi:hypothetical protein
MQLYSYYLERTENFGGISHIPVMLFNGTIIISTTLSYVIQVVCFVGSWLVFYGMVKLFKRN